MKYTLLLLNFLIVIFNAMGQNEKSLTLITDQDFFYFLKSKNEDRNYTQGTSITLSDLTLYNTILFSPFKGYNNLRSFVFKSKSINPVMSSTSIFATAFSPKVIDSKNPIIGDRPFAFLLGISFNQISRVGDKFGNGSNYEALTINVGLIGTNIGYDFQSFAHTYLVTGRPIEPIGWNNQISKGGKFTLLFNYERLKFFSLIPVDVSGWGIDGSLNLGGSLGYYDRAYFATYLRFGWINQNNMPNWAFFGNCLATADMNSIQPVIDESTLKLNQKRKYNGIEIFGFAKFTNNLMFRNSLLVGQKFVHNDIYTLKGSWTNTYIFDFDFGVALGIYWIKNPNDDVKYNFIKILYKNTVRSAEFDSGIFPKRYHYFGSVGLQFSL